MALKILACSNRTSIGKWGYVGQLSKKIKDFFSRKKLKDSLQDIIGKKNISAILKVNSISLRLKELY